MRHDAVRLHHGGTLMSWPKSFFSSRKPLTLGIDISAFSIKILQLSCVDEQYCVQAFGQQMLPQQLMAGNIVQDIPGLGRAVQELLIKLDLWSDSKHRLQAVIAVPDACTIHKTVQVSERLSEADLEELVTLELAKCIPDSLDEVYFDFKHLDNVTQSGIKNLLIIAARAQYVKDRVAALRDIGLPVTVVDIESLAIQRVLPFLLSHPKPLGMIAILHLGLKCIKVFFFKQAKVLLIHEEDLDLLTSAGCGSFSAYQDAILHCFKRASHFLHAEYSNGAVLDYIIAAGEGAQLSQVIDWLQQHSEKPVYCANPFENVLIDTDCDHSQLMFDAPLYVTAFGLAKRLC